jgi:hypothetical protein
LSSLKDEKKIVTHTIILTEFYIFDTNMYFIAIWL